MRSPSVTYPKTDQGGFGMQRADACKGRSEVIGTGHGEHLGCSQTKSTNTTSVVYDRPGQDGVKD